MGPGNAQGRAGLTAVFALVLIVLLAPATAQAAWQEPVQISSLEAEAPAASAAQVVVDEEGTATATWIADGEVLGAQRPHGGPWGDIETLTDGTATDVFEQHLHIGRDGRVGVTWTGFDDTTPVVQATSRAMGADAWTASGTVSASTPQSSISWPRIAVGPDGMLTVVWSENPPESGATDRAMEATRPDPDADWQSPEQINAPPTASVVLSMAVETDQAGDTTVIWSAYYPTPAPGTSRMEFADRPADSDVWTAGPLPGGSAASGGLIYTTDLSVNAEGAAVAAWWHDRGGGNYASSAARRPAAGGPWDVDRLSADTDQGVAPQVELDASGNAVAVWITDDRDGDADETENAIRTASAPLNGDWTAPVVLDEDIQVQSLLSFDGRPDGRTIVGWATPDEVLAAERPPGGTFAVEPVDDSSGGDIGVALDPVEGAVAVWPEDGDVFASEQEPPPASDDAVAYVHDDSEIRRVEPDATNDAAITAPDGPNDHRPEWSPNGGLLAFDSDRSGTQELWTVAPSGEEPTRIPGAGDGVNQGMDPTWSPDGATLAFTSLRDGRICPQCVFNTEIYRVPVTGGAAQRLTNNAVLDDQPAWSPDGETIAFVRQDADGGDSDIWLMDADGTNQRAFLDADALSDSDPAWSPDGERLAWTRDNDGTDEIWIADADGQNAAEATNGREPAWSADCTQLAVTRETPGVPPAPGEEGGTPDNLDVYIVPLDDAGDEVQATTSTADDEAPAWRRSEPACEEEDDGLTVSIDDADAGEGDTATFNVHLSEAPDYPVTVTASTDSDTAESGTDFAAKSADVSFATGQQTASFTVDTTADSVDEDDETFAVTLSDAEGAENPTIDDGTADGTIADDDPAPTLYVNSVTVTEGDAGQTAMVFDITRVGASAKEVSVTATTQDGTATTAGGDYVTRTETVDVPADGATFTVQVNGDAVDEDEETFGVVLSDPANATIAQGSGTGTIADDDDPPPPPPEVSIDDASADEGDEVTFTLSLDTPAAETVTVDAATADDTATAGDDYTAASDTVTFAAGETTAELSVQTTEDGADEADETFDVTLSNPSSNATIDDGEGVGTIVDDDEPDPSAPQVSIGDVTVTERDQVPASATIELTLDEAPEQDVSVGFATADGTALQPGDYKPAGGRATFVAGDTDVEVPVAIEGDRLDEPSEHLVVRLSSPIGLTIADDEGRIEITDDDAAPSADGFDAYALESSPAMVFPVELRRPSGKAVTIEYRTVDHSASAPSDYVAKTGTLTIPAGQTSGSISVAVVDDQIREADYERFTVDLGRASVPLVAGELVGTIVDDEHGVAPAPTYPEGTGRRAASAQRDTPLPGVAGPLVPRLVIGAGTLRPSADGTVGVRVRCTVGDGGCTGRMRVLFRGRVLASSRLAVAAGRTTTARVRLSRAGRRLLRSRRRMRVQVEVTLGGVRSVRTTTLMRKAGRP